MPRSNAAYSARRLRGEVRSQRWTYFLLLCYLVGFHLRLSVYSGDVVVVPMFLMLGSAILLAFKVGNELVRRTGHLVIALALFLIFQPLVAFAPGSAQTRNLFSAIQLLAAILAALVVIYAASRLDPRGLRKFFLGFWVVLMALALLETIGMRPMFEDVRNSIYEGTGRGVYASDNRDLMLYGKVRPSAFASEPSFLADSYLCMAVLVFLLDKNRGKLQSWGVLALMMGVGFVLAPSAKVVFFLLALVVWHWWPKTSRAFVGLTIAMATVATWLYLKSDTVVAPLIGRFELGETGSFFGRISAAPRVGVEALWDYPLLGYGIGNTDGLYPVIQTVWMETSAFARFPWYQGANASNLMSNGFWWQWSYLGFVGGVVFSVLVVKLLTSLGVQSPARTLVCSWIVWYAGAAFVDPASWWIVAVFAIPAMSSSSPLSVPESNAKTAERGVMLRQRR